MIQPNGERERYNVHSGEPKRVQIDKDSFKGFDNSNWIVCFWKVILRLPRIRIVFSFFHKIFLSYSSLPQFISHSMVQASTGTLLTLDPPTKQIILRLNSNTSPPFVIQDLDETHLFVKSEYVKRVMEEVERCLEEVTFKGVDV